MWLEKNNSVLRLTLNAPHDIPCFEHEAFLAEVAWRTTHSIRIYERFFRWTCVPYAFGFAKDPLYGEIPNFEPQNEAWPLMREAQGQVFRL
jgi:hypothetical protein